MPKGFYETLETAAGDGTAVTAAAATTLLPAAAKYTLRPNYFNYVGKQLLLIAHGRESTVITTPGTLRFDIRLGGTVVWDSLAVALATAEAYTNVAWKLEVLLTCRAIGSSANLIGIGTLTAHNIAGAPATMPKGALVAPLPWNTAPAVGSNFDSTASQQVDLFFTQTVATGSITLHGFSLIDPTSTGGN
jgi:hypothetical protein